MKQTVVIGMSGGVDSSVAALLLKEQGFEVIGLFMKNWEEQDAQGLCTSARDFEDVQKVCSQLQIPCYSVNFVQQYRDEVFNEFLREYREGLTPNPDVLCNRQIKFKHFLQKALELRADYLATGHYCRVDPTGQLFKGTDPKKDQSYFLHAVPKEALKKVLFPLGAYTKQEVRLIAKKAALATAEKKDSTGICFIGKRDFKTFLSQYVAKAQGTFQTLSGQIVGRHTGHMFYTIGQRHGMQLGGEGEPWYVVDKDPQRNIVFVERGAQHPALFCDTLQAHALHWLTPPSTFPFLCTAKVRYRQEDTPCRILSCDQEIYQVAFTHPQRAVTPGQSIVFYQNDCCLGGGVIASRGPSYAEQSKEPSPSE